MFSWNGVYSSQTLQRCRIRPTGKGSRRKSRWEAMDGGKSGACVGKLGLQCGVEENMLGKRSQGQAVAELVGYGAEPRAWNASHNEGRTLEALQSGEAACDEMGILERLE